MYKRAGRNFRPAFLVCDGMQRVSSRFMRNHSRILLPAGKRIRERFQLCHTQPKKRAAWATAKVTAMAIPSGMTAESTAHFMLRVSL
ncbi:hypothetical protein D3C81_1921950 [compost metagenome]